MSDASVDSYGVLQDNGEFRIGFNLTPESIESLKTLYNSPHWKLYREVLISAKTEYFNSILPKTETNDIVKNIGIVTGINLAINQLGVLVAEHNRREQKARELADKGNKDTDFIRG